MTEQTRLSLMHCKCNQVLYVCAQWGTVVQSLQVEKGDLSSSCHSVWAIVWGTWNTVFALMVFTIWWWSVQHLAEHLHVWGSPYNFSTRSSNFFARGCTASELGSVRSLLLLGRCLGWFASMAMSHGYHACIGQFGTTSTPEAWSSLIFWRHLPMILKGGKT